MRKYGFSALVAAGLLVGGLATGSASAADLGGNCCADLEERIAELEATTARKGNRKVSLTISGWVGEQVMWWDDGVEDNVYVVGLGTTLSSHFKMTGAAQISPGWSAGYVIHVEAISSDSLTISQDASIGRAATLAGAGDPANGAIAGYGVQLLQSFWFIKSDHIGKVGVGLQSQASDNTAILVDGSGSLVPANWVAFEYNSFVIRDNTGVFSPIVWGGIGGCVGGGAIGDCNGLTQHVVRYDSPTFGGFSVSASWGEDEMWDVAARYAGEWSGFKVAAAAAYNELTGGNLGPAVGTFEYFQAGAYVQHVATGLWLYGAYGDAENDATTGDAQNYYIKGGLRERWHPLGHTVLYVEYMQNDSSGDFVQGVLDEGADEDSLDPTSGEFDMWGVGIVQEIDAAAMSIWLSYRHMEYNDNGCNYVDGGSRAVTDVACGTDVLDTLTSYKDFEYIKFGALINF